MQEIYGRKINGFNFADLHMHTTASLDVRRRNNGMSPQETVLSAEKAKLHTIAITDHDFLPSSFEAYEFSEKERLSVNVISGMELTTLEGHLLALNISSPIEKGLSMQDSISQIHKQKGLAVAPHPFFGLIKSCSKKTIDEIANSENPEVYLDDFEIYNAGVEDVTKRKKSIRDTNALAQIMYENQEVYLGAAIGNSDGHRMTVGRGLTTFKGDLAEAIKTRKTMAVRLDPPDNRERVIAAIQLFGETRVLGTTSFEEFERRYKESQ